MIRRFPIDYNKLRRRASRLLGAFPYWRWKAKYWRPSFRIPGMVEAMSKSGADLIHIGPLPYTNLMYAGFEAAEACRVPVVATPCTHLGEEANDEVARHYVQPYQIDLLQALRQSHLHDEDRDASSRRLGCYLRKAGGRPWHRFRDGRRRQSGIPAHATTALMALWYCTLA